MNEDLREALDALRVAENHFAFADAEHIEAAIFELNAAESRLSAVICYEKANAGRKDSERRKAVSEYKNLPCGLSYRLPRFCAGRACITCPLRRTEKDAKAPKKGGGKQ